MGRDEIEDNGKNVGGTYGVQAKKLGVTETKMKGKKCQQRMWLRLELTQRPETVKSLKVKKSVKLCNINQPEGR